MRIKANLTTHKKRPIILPKHYINKLQAFVYNLMDPFLRSFLHEQGYKFGNRRFKLFCFSDLIGKFRFTKDEFVFYPPVSILLSSPKNELLESMAVGLVKGMFFYIGKNQLMVDSIEIIPQPNFSSGRVLAKLITPLTVYSSFRDMLGTQKTYYYTPFEETFSRLVVENLRKKYLIIYGTQEDFDFQISPYRISKSDKRILFYEKRSKDNLQRTVINGWVGLYLLSGNSKTLDLAYNCGLGAKNSQGFGMWEVEKFLDNFSVSQNCKGATGYESEDFS